MINFIIATFSLLCRDAKNIEYKKIEMKGIWGRLLEKMDFRVETVREIQSDGQREKKETDR